MSKDTKNEHHLILEKFTPESLVALRTELALPQNKDIFDRANKESTFEGCLATIAECLDIAVDGYYDVADLCDVLATAMRARSLHGNQPHLRDKRLVNAELVERAGEVSLEEVSSEVPGVIAPPSTKEVAPFDTFLSAEDKAALHFGTKILEREAEWEKFLTEEAPRTCSNCCYKEYEIMNATMMCINTPNGFALGPDKVCNKWEPEKKQVDCSKCSAWNTEEEICKRYPEFKRQETIPCECGRGEVCDEKCR